jgi:thioredoxin-like negative regulator of GroEL
MAKRGKVNGLARPVRTKRDYERASEVVKRLSKQADRDSAAELRLQALLKELEEYDEIEEASEEDAEDLSYEGPRRRWSDNGSDDR